MAAIGADELKALDEKWMGTPLRWEPYSQIVGVALAVLALLGAGMAFWVRSLRIAVASKTRELEAKTARLEDSEERFRALFEDTVSVHHTLAPRNKTFIHSPLYFYNT